MIEALKQRWGVKPGTHVYIGPPCGAGHEGLRYATSSTCVACKKLQGLSEYRRKRPAVQRVRRKGRRAHLSVSQLARRFAVTPRVTGLAEWHRERRGTETHQAG